MKFIYDCAVSSIKLFNNGFGDDAGGENQLELDGNDTMDTTWMALDENMNDIMPVPPIISDNDFEPIQSQQIDSTQSNVDENENENAIPNGNENENAGNQDMTSLLGELSSIPSQIVSGKKKSMGKKRRTLLVDEISIISGADMKKRISK